MRKPARMLAAVLAYSVVVVACASAEDAGKEPGVEAPAILPQAYGDSCGPTTPCAQGYCVRGVCCSTPCTQACWSCSASDKQDGSADGTCGPSKAGKTPSGDCYAHNLGPAPECYAFVCNGQGVCSKPAGTPCDAQCAGDLLQAYTCNAAGQCKSTPIDCGNYSCGTDQCFTNCDFDDDSKCAAGYFCRNGACIQPQPNGVSCSKSSHCQSGHCVDGVCCSSACNAPCQTCLAAKKSSGITGDCGEVKVGLDPDGDCDPAGPCGTNGSCDGGGACALFPGTTVCGAATCAPSPTLGGTSEVSGLLCDGMGQCLTTSTTKECTGYATCAPSGECPTKCVSSAECALGFSCYDVDNDNPDEECAQKLTSGTCTDHDQCQTNFCYDQHCCDVECGGVCESCETGTCKPALGAPIGKDKECPGATLEDPCLARECDGKNVDTCEGFVGAAIACRPASCADGVKTLAGSCDGAGHCEEPQTGACGGFACNGLDCKTSCATNDDCSSGAVCDTTSGKCAKGSYCANDITLTDLNGKLTDCSPFRCVGGSCVAACSANDQCAEGFLCDRASGDCVLSVASDEPEAPSCWCGMPPTRRTTAGVWVLGAAIVVSLARRRSRRR